jgi:hypothetical protein
VHHPRAFPSASLPSSCLHSLSIGSNRDVLERGGKNHVEPKTSEECRGDDPGSGSVPQV